MLSHEDGDRFYVVNCHDIIEPENYNNTINIIKLIYFKNVSDKYPFRLHKVLFPYNWWN